ncbi:hypothetical protein EG68_04114 [Paragonimus skrjabini miyazakii]|uniref:Hexosyltransferase n=1 Tax=Paragonimus skrjabini miyazakii TaxID=59628 RepID=A0A8S9YSX6_9TREM|nr:hypothetical protein EG68_04114 [Paragonimus skrjabini miyazakii]
MSRTSLPLNGTCRIAQAGHRSKAPAMLNLTLMDTRICSDLREPVVLIVIRTRPERQDRRVAIRATWANLCTYDQNKVRYLFLTGKQPGPQSAYVDEVLQREFDCYGDIVQYDSLDGYRLLPKKQFIALSLVHHLCSNFPFVFMTDEDFLINIPNLVKYVLQIRSENQTSFVGGHLHKNMQPDRDKKSKYYVEYDVYPNKTYPPFVAGGASLMSTSLIQSILAEIRTLQTEIHLEDVRMGIVLQRLGIESKDIKEVCLWPADCSNVPLSNVIANHGYDNVASLYEDWKKLNFSENC